MMIYVGILIGISRDFFGVFLGQKINFSHVNTLSWQCLKIDIEIAVRTTHGGERWKTHRKTKSKPLNANMDRPINMTAAPWATGHKEVRRLYWTRRFLQPSPVTKTMQTRKVNCSPIPVERISITARMPLSLMPIQPIRPAISTKRTTVIKTCKNNEKNNLKKSKNGKFFLKKNFFQKKFFNF